MLLGADLAVDTYAVGRLLRCPFVLLALFVRETSISTHPCVAKLRFATQSRRRRGYHPPHRGGISSRQSRDIINSERIAIPPTRVLRNCVSQHNQAAGVDIIRRIAAVYHHGKAVDIINSERIAIPPRPCVAKLRFATQSRRRRGYHPPHRGGISSRQSRGCHQF